MKNLKKALIALIAIFTIITLAACSSTTKSSNTWTKAEKTKSITIGFDNTFVPMGYKDKDGTYKGFDIDLANAVFKEYGIKVKWQPINWSMKEQELKQGNIDLIWNGYSVTSERKKLVLFSDIYMDGGDVLVTAKSSGITSKADMKGQTIGVQSASSQYQEFESEPKILKDIVAGNTISQYSNFDQGFLDLQNGRIKALLVDGIYANYYLKQAKQTDNYNIINAGYAGSPMAVGARKTDKELISKINKGIVNLHKTGAFQKISEKWFGKDVYPTSN
jgi:polar amino acid transport system substrate-binding protein